MLACLVAVTGCCPFIDPLWALLIGGMCTCGPRSRGTAPVGEEQGGGGRGLEGGAGGRVGGREKRDEEGAAVPPCVLSSIQC